MAMNGRIGKNVIHVFPAGPFGPSCANILLFCPRLRGQETDRAFRDDERGVSTNGRDAADIANRL